MHDIKRAVLPTVKRLLKTFPCVAIIGARQVGKTTLLKQVMPKALFFDLEKRADFELIQRDPDFFLSQYNTEIIIDEAQILDRLFPALRVAIDQKRRQKGRFLISGSASPELIKHLSESLAGRIGILELPGFSLAESWGKTSKIYNYLAAFDVKKLLKLSPQLSRKNLFKSCIYGAYPEPFLELRNDKQAFRFWMDNYFQTYIRRDIRNLFSGLNLLAYQRFIAMLAGSSGHILNFSEFSRSLDVSQPTIKSYFQIAHGTFIWRMIPSYQRNVSKRITKMPKGYMRDSGLLNYILRNNSLEALQIHPNFGRIWEGFIVEELLKGFSNNGIKVEPFYYRTSNQAEIDLILEADFGMLPIEIKASTNVPQKSLICLKEFIRENKLPLGIVINLSEQPVWLSPNILQIPAVCL